MKTLIELWDERPIENVLSADVFNPQRLIYLCPTEVAQSRTRQAKIREYFEKRHGKMEVIFMETSKFHTDRIENQLRKIIEEYDDCAMDITGGTDNMLFAAGKVCAQKNNSVFTYSHQNKRFYNISNAEFVDGVTCENIYEIRDYIEMAGGTIKEGRVADDSLVAHMDFIEPLFRVFLKYKGRWDRIVSWFQQSCREAGTKCTDAAYTQNIGKGIKVSCPEDCLRDLEKAGLLRNVSIGETVSYEFYDTQIKFWLRDVGSALEVFTYKKALDSMMFTDCKCSVIVEWDSDTERDKVSNEIDVMAVGGVTPYFISCKACKINTYALNELEILRDRFGGEGAVAVIVSSEKCNSATRKRAEALNIHIADIDDLRRELNDG